MRASVLNRTVPQAKVTEVIFSMHSSENDSSIRMAERSCDTVTVAAEISVVFFRGSHYMGDFAGHAGFFCNDCNHNEMVLSEYNELKGSFEGASGLHRLLLRGG